MESTKDAQKKSELAATQGKAYSDALAYMASQDVSAQAEVDDYIVTFVCEDAEGMYYPTGEGALEWQRPAENQNLHIEVAVQDKVDKRFIPGLAITVQLLDGDRHAVGEEMEVPLLWHPFLLHYGRDWSVPGNGTYSARATIAQPQFGRHDSLVGKRYVRTVTVTLGPVKVEIGQKPTGPE